MLDHDTDHRLTAWLELRKHINISPQPFKDLIEFWNEVPFVPLNHLVDPYNQYDWPTPWEIIVHNKYDDFTKAVMIGYTLLLTDRYKNSKVEIRTLVDNDQNMLYNTVYVDDHWVINYKDNQEVTASDIGPTLRLENLIELQRPR